MIEKALLIFGDAGLIESRRQRGIKYIVVGICPEKIEEIAIDTDYNAIVAAKQWAKNNRGDAFCYCVQDGRIGGRPFDGYFFSVDGQVLSAKAA